MKYLKFFESYIDTDELKREIDEFLENNCDYISSTGLLDLIKNKLGLDDDSSLEVSTKLEDGFKIPHSNSNVLLVVIQLDSEDFIKVYLTDNLEYDAGINNHHFGDSFYFNKALLQ